MSAVLIVTLGLALSISVAGPTTAALGAPPAASSHAPRSTSSVQPHNLADSDISFAPAISYTIPSPNGGVPQSIATTDFNHDGKPDLTVAAGNIYVLFGTGDGNFATPISSTVGPSANAIATGDFNGDGKTDMVVATGANTVAVLLGNGAGGFGPPISSPAGSDPSFVLVADFNNDGKADLAVANYGNGIFSASVLLGNGDGSFQPPINFDTQNEVGQMAVADFNHDGKLDIVAAGAGTSWVSVLLGNGDGTFQLPQRAYTAYSPIAVAAADFNHDGNADIVAVQGYGLDVLLGNGDGTFQPAAYFPDNSNPSTIAAADFNLDGNLDVVTGDYGSVSALSGVGDGNFQSEVGFLVGDGNSTITVGDFNGDGKPDVAAANPASGTISVLINNTTIPIPTSTPAATATATPAPPCHDDALGAWSNTSPLSAHAEGVAVTSNGVYAYAAGGAGSGGFGNPIGLDRYDPATRTWLQLASYFPNDAMAEVYSPINNKIYFFGGFQVGGVSRDTNIYDIANDTWSYGRQMPQGRAAMATGYWNGKIYLAGGEDQYYTYTQTWEYDPVADIWNTARAGIPASLGDPGFGLINGHLYIAGGVSYPSLYNATYDYDIASNTWATRTNMLTGVYGPGSAVVDGRLYVFGGRSSFSVGLAASARHQQYGPAALPQTVTPLDATQVYNPTTNSWTYGPLLGVPRYETGGAAVGNTVIAVGGVNNYGSQSNSVEQANVSVCSPPATSTPTPTNTPSGPTPTGCANPFVDIAGNIFYGAIHYLACANVINGTDAMHYTPSGTATRGQFAKVVVLGFGTPFYTPGTPDFTDVPASNFAYLYIESGFHAGILSGFDQASCTAHGVAYHCYLPNLAITRAQLTKLVVGAAHYPLYTPTSGQTFNDVPPHSIFYAFVETAHQKGVINGYPDGGFRPNNSIRRDEMAQIVYKGITTP